MPINIYIEETSERLDWLCDGIWDLPFQMDAFETWLNQKGKNLKPNKYVADIGFCIRENASAGGGVLNSNSMKIMGKIGMDIFFSEYPTTEQH